MLILKELLAEDFLSLYSEEMKVAWLELLQSSVKIAIVLLKINVENVSFTILVLSGLQSENYV